MKKKFFIILITLLCSYINAEVRNYKDENKGYNVFIEIDPIGQNLKQSDIDEYSHQLFTWSETLGKDAKILENLSDILEWGINEALAEISLEIGTTYISQIRFDNNQNDIFFTHAIVLFTIKSKNPRQLKIETIIIVQVTIDELKETSSVETSENNYENKSLGYKGSAFADFIGNNLSTEELDNLNEFVYSFASKNGQVRAVKKFTKEQEWLVNQALNKYELKKDETYTVLFSVMPKSFPTTFSKIISIITITEIDKYNNFSYNFIAYESTQVNSDPDEESDSVIESRIDGDFEGWDGDTIFKLQNGQIWQQVEYSYKYSYKYCPKVIIVKSPNGWIMQVDGIEKTIRVQRLK